jgi:uncharacterized membrane protein
MKTPNVDLMRQARESLNGKWGLAIGTYVVYILIFLVLQGPTIIFPHNFMFAFPSGILVLLIGGPLSVGIALFGLTLARNQEASTGQIFLGFSKFGICLAAYLLVAVFTFLWTLLLIIPGIIAAFSYSMTFFILADEESIGAMEAIDKSKKMMNGYKWKYFCLMLRFIGWGLLCILTLGIGFLWLVPYIQVSSAKFYDDVKTQLILRENPQPAV